MQLHLSKMSEHNVEFVFSPLILSSCTTLWATRKQSFKKYMTKIIKKLLLRLLQRQEGVTLCSAWSSAHPASNSSVMLNRRKKNIADTPVLSFHRGNSSPGCTLKIWTLQEVSVWSNMFVWLLNLVLTFSLGEDIVHLRSLMRYFPSSLQGAH